MDFNIKDVYRNIKILSMQKEVSIGDIEKEANVSQGFMSRVLNKDKNSDVNKHFNLIITASQMLSVPFDALVLNDFNKNYEKLSKDVIDALSCFDVSKDILIKIIRESKNNDRVNSRQSFLVQR